MTSIRKKISVCLMATVLIALVAVGASSMALNISYSAWAVLFGLILLGSVPGPVEIICCVAILCGTILAACDWKELFSRGKGQA